MLLNTMAGQEVIWVGGYPRIVGVNVPAAKDVGVQPVIKPSPVDKPLPSAPAGGHDLRGGHAAPLQKPAI